jgi:hypothetical protein
MIALYNCYYNFNYNCYYNCNTTIVTNQRDEHSGCRREAYVEVYVQCTGCLPSTRGRLKRKRTLYGGSWNGVLLMQYLGWEQNILRETE